MIKEIEIGNRFWNKENENNILNVKIKEITSTEFGFFLWPSSILLSEYLFFHRHIFSDKHIVEVLSFNQFNNNNISSLFIQSENL